MVIVIVNVYLHIIIIITISVNIITSAYPCLIQRLSSTHPHYKLGLYPTILNH